MTKWKLLGAVAALLAALPVQAEPWVGVWTGMTLNYVNGENCQLADNDLGMTCDIYPTDVIVQGSDRQLVYVVSTFYTGIQFNDAVAFLEAVKARGRGDKVLFLTNWNNPRLQREITTPYRPNGETWSDVPDPGDRQWWYERVELPFRRVAALAEWFPDTVLGMGVDFEMYFSQPGSPHKFYQPHTGTHRCLPWLRKAMEAVKEFSPDLVFAIVNADVGEARIYKTLHVFSDLSLSERYYTFAYLDHETCGGHRQPVMRHIEKWEDLSIVDGKMVMGLHVTRMDFLGTDRGYHDVPGMHPIVRVHMQTFLEQDVPIFIYAGKRFRKDPIWGSVGLEASLRELKLGATTPLHDRYGRYVERYSSMSRECDGVQQLLRVQDIEPGSGIRVPGSRARR